MNHETVNDHKQNQGENREDVEYFQGFYIFHNDSIEVLMDEETYDKHWRAYMVRYGIETRTNAELVEYATQVESQHFAAEQVLFNPDYWRDIHDPKIRIIPLNKTYQPKQTEVRNA